MPVYEDRTANIQRTPEELLSISYSLDQINAVVPGYPELDDRLYIAPNEEIPRRIGNILGRQINQYEIPGGHDATNSIYRAETLANVPAASRLYGIEDPDLPTSKAEDWSLPDGHPTVVRALRAGCRDFTQHMQPLVPGWRELLAIRTQDGRELGMPTGIGWYTHYWLSDMCDAVTMRLAEDGDDIDVLLYTREEDNQSEQVWATPGGYVIKADVVRPEVTPLQAASERRTSDRTDRDISGYAGVPLRVKYPISSGNTLVAGLKTTPYGRFVSDPDYMNEPSLVNPESVRPTEAGKRAGYVSLRAICESNPSGGSSGQNHEQQSFPVWTTHFEYLVAGLNTVTDEENRLRLGIEGRQFTRLAVVADELRQTYPMLDHE